MNPAPASSGSFPPQSCRPRLLLVATYYFPRNYGGAVQIYDGLLRRMTRWDVCVLSEQQQVDDQARARFDQAAPSERGYAMQRLPRLVLHFSEGKGRLGHLLELLRFFPQTRRAFRAAVARLRPDVVICGATFSTGWLMRALPPGVPYANYIHGEELTMRRNTGPLDRHLAATQSDALRRAPLNLVVSRYSAETLQRLVGVEPHRIHLLPNAIDTERFAPPADREALRARLGWQGRTVVLTIARLIARKGIDQLLRALAQAHAAGRLPADWLYCVGGQGPEEAALRTLVGQLGLGEHVRFLGFIANEELPAFYGAADLFALTNREIEGDTEGFGIVFLEANACGVPVLGGTAGGTGDAIADDVSGLRVDGDAVDAIAAALGRLLGDPALRQRMGAAGLRRAREQFGLTARARELEATLLGLLPPGAGDRG